MKKLLLLAAAILASACAHAQVVPAPPGVAALVCANNTVVPAPTDGKFFYVQCDGNGKLITTGGGGGGGSPGGTSGQIQWNSSGSFAGFTASGDATINTGTGAVTFATVNGNVGSFGNTTQCVSVTVNAKGLITAVSAAACAPPFTAVTGRATLAQLPQGIANSIWINPTGSTADMTNVTVPACANDGAHGLVYVNGTGLQCASITAGVSSTTGGIGVTCSPTTGSVVCGAPATRRDNTATTDTITSTDKGTIVTESNASSVAVAITTAGFVSTDYFTVKNLGAGAATYTPSSGTIDGAATLVCSQNQSADLYFDGTNYKTLASSCRLNVSGTSALGTGAISSATCATVVTTAGAGIATTDVVGWGFNGDPTAVTGYVPLTAGMLTIIAYPSSGNVNFKVCNNTSGSITPGAITLNWRVTR